MAEAGASYVIDISICDNSTQLVLVPQWFAGQLYISSDENQYVDDTFNLNNAPTVQSGEADVKNSYNKLTIMILYAGVIKTDVGTWGAWLAVGTVIGSKRLLGEPAYEKVIYGSLTIGYNKDQVELPSWDSMITNPAWSVEHKFWNCPDFTDMKDKILNDTCSISIDETYSLAPPTKVENMWCRGCDEDGENCSISEVDYTSNDMEISIQSNGSFYDSPGLDLGDQLKIFYGLNSKLEQTWKIGVTVSPIPGGAGAQAIIAGLGGGGPFGGGNAGLGGGFGGGGNAGNLGGAPNFGGGGGAGGIVGGAPQAQGAQGGVTQANNNPTINADGNITDTPAKIKQVPIPNFFDNL